MEMPNGWYKLADGRKVFRAKTVYGTIMYYLDERTIKELFFDGFFLFLAKIDEIPTTWEEIEEVTGMDRSKYLDVEIELENEDIFKESEHLIEIASKYHSDNIEAMISDALGGYFAESLFKALLERAGKGHFILKTTEIEVFKQIWRIQEADTKERINPKKASGRDKYWTPAKCHELVEKYERLLSVVKEARRAYKSLEWIKEETNRRKTVKEQYPDLPDQILERFEMEGQRISPQYLTLGYLSPHFEGRSEEAMITVINDTRRQSKGGKDSET
jgi:hypothetical protein